ncbi:MAG TPA: cytochrome c [Planctomycetota bacterium]|jgi:mono/diheme cytochrome c family protein|nr:cytochrome c [Planctomycetota bacterium]
MRKPTLLVAACIALTLTGCGESEKSSRGIDFMPEMYNHPGYESQTARAVTDGKTVHHVPMMLEPVDGTVSRDGAAYALAPTDFAAAKGLVNPLTPSTAVLKRGQFLFNRTCAMCHGRDGDAANGYVASTKDHPERFGGVPSLNTANVALLSDGEIYHIVSRGRNRMQDLSAQLLPHDRWAVVLYVSALARATQAVGDAETRLAKLEKEAQEAIKNNDPYEKADLEAARALAAQRKRDLLLIQQGGEGDEFIPPKKPVPEYVKPSWKAE